jgi:TetR/AcrR family transcriptional regulator of autoinduction and epiphytic fitness
MATETYHQRIRAEKRLAALQAAMQLFLEQGYERTSLQQVATRAEVSTATLFKRFPTKAALFQAMVQEYWSAESFCSNDLPTGSPENGLRKLGTDYLRRMRRSEMQAIYRVIISESSRFPDLGQMLFNNSKGPFLERIKAYLLTEMQAGTLSVDSAEVAADQFLAMLSGQCFWPELVAPGCGGTDQDAADAIVQAVATLLGPSRFSVRKKSMTQ